MSHPPSSRRRGGQPGNINSLKHGLYSRRLAPPTNSLAASLTERLDARFQLALARKRLLQLVCRQEAASIHDWLSHERGILHYLALIRDLAQETLHAPLLNSIDPREHDEHPSVGMFESLRLLDAELLGDPQTDGLPIRTSKRHSGSCP
jgi:hypothetical protein